MLITPLRFTNLHSRTLTYTLLRNNFHATAFTMADTVKHDLPQLSGIEASKRRAAYKAVEDHFNPNYRYIGIGSGSTVVYVVEAIAERGREITSKMIFVPTGDQSKQIIIEAGLPLGSIDSLPPVDGTVEKMSEIGRAHV